MCLISIKLFIVRTILCATVQTYTTFTTITTRLLFYSAYNLFASNTYSLFFSHNYSLFFSHPYSLDLHSEELQTATSHKAEWILTNSLPDLSTSFICAHLQSAECSLSKRFAFLPSRELYSDSLYMCILILVCPSCLLLLVYLEGVRCIC